MLLFSSRLVMCHLFLCHFLLLPVIFFYVIFFSLRVRYFRCRLCYFNFSCFLLLPFHIFLLYSSISLYYHHFSVVFSTRLAFYCRYFSFLIFSFMMFSQLFSFLQGGVDGEHAPKVTALSFGGVSGGRGRTPRFRAGHPAGIPRALGGEAGHTAER